MIIRNLNDHGLYFGAKPHGKQLAANGAANDADRATIADNVENFVSATEKAVDGEIEILVPPSWAGPRIVSHTVTAADVTATEVVIDLGASNEPRAIDFFATRAGVRLVTDGALSFSEGSLTLGIGSDGLNDDPTVALAAADEVTFLVYY